MPLAPEVEIPRRPTRRIRAEQVRPGDLLRGVFEVKFVHLQNSQKVYISHEGGGETWSRSTYVEVCTDRRIDDER